MSNFAKDIQEKYMPEVKKIPNATLYNFAISIADKTKVMPKEKYFLFFGRLSYEKGVRTLLETFKELPNCKLKIAGTGPKEEELKDYVHTMGMDNVEFLGYKRGKELQNLVKEAYFVIVPSEWYENNPMTIIEAYSEGTPVIGAKIGGIPEIVVENETGYQFVSGDSCDMKSKVMQTDDLSFEEYSNLSIGALKFAHEKLSIDSYYPRLIAFYNQFIKKHCI